MLIQVIHNSVKLPVGEIDFSPSINKVKYPVTLEVCDTDEDNSWGHLLLGTNFISRLSALFDFSAANMDLIGEDKAKFALFAAPENNEAVYTVIKAKKDLSRIPYSPFGGELPTSKSDKLINAATVGNVDKIFFR